MKTWVVLALWLAAVGEARADAFAFKGVDGYEKCMALDHLVETVNTVDGAQARILSSLEIQQRCIAAAVKLVTVGKNKDATKAFVVATKRQTAHVNALDLIIPLVDQSLAACNDMEIYDVLLRGLENGASERYYLPRARTIAKRCLKDAAFRKDFLEEQDSGDETIAREAVRGDRRGARSSRGCARAS